MAEKIHGVATSIHSLTDFVQYFACYTSSPGAFTNPMPNPPEDQSLDRLINIQVTGKTGDESQKNFEVLLMSVGLRAMPVFLTNPVAVMNLSAHTLDLSGEGFIWKFAVERGAQFHNYTPYGTPGPVGLLIDELNGIILPSGARIVTVSGDPSGLPKNTSFAKLELT